MNISVDKKVTLTDEYKIEHYNQLQDNFNKVSSERDTLKADNDLLKESISKKDKNYMATLNAKNKRIKELESQLSAYESKQIDMFEVK